MTHKSEPAQIHLHRDGTKFKDKVKLCSQENQGKLQNKRVYVNKRKMKIKVKVNELIATQKGICQFTFFSEDAMSIF